MEKKQEIEEASFQIKTFLGLSKEEKLTALWALSESALGGLLHAFKLPFRGMIISSVAIVIIGMMARIINKPGKILKSALVVVFIKVAINPHTPIMAYLSVLIQGLLGEVFFFTSRFRFIFALLLGIFVAFLNGFQKILVLTLIYGNTLWKAIDDFFNYIAKEWLLSSISKPIEFSYLIISFYIGAHLIIGIAAGILAFTVPESVEEKLKEPVIFTHFNNLSLVKKDMSKSRKRKWLKSSAIIILIISLLIVILNYFYPITQKVAVNDILIMIARSVVIMSFWFFVLAPSIKKTLQKFFFKKQNRYIDHLSLYLTSISTFKALIVAGWKESSNFKGIKRLNQFMVKSLVYLLRDYEQY